MNTYTKLRKPFMFWLVQQCLPANDKNTKTKPISNREFYGTMVLIVFALISLSIVFNTIC